MRIISTDPDQPGFFAVGQVAVGVIALGQSALGVIAIGQLARGVLCVGQGAVGIVAVGQGAIGLWHATAMLGLAGRTGSGLVLHLLPFRVKPPQANRLVATTTIEALLDGRESEGWVDCVLSNGHLDEPRIDASAIAAELVAAAQKRRDRAQVLVRAEVVADESGYRSAEKHVLLAARDVIAYDSRPEVTYAYATIPKNALGPSASPSMIALRSLLWLAALAIVSLVTFVPLVQALRHLH
jgi:hypothetical protein